MAVSVTVMQLSTHVQLLNLSKEPFWLEHQVGQAVSLPFAQRLLTPSKLTSTCRNE